VLTSGEGGAVTTSDQELYKRMKLLRGQGMDPTRRYFFSDIGYNFRLTNLQCALLCAQLDRKEEILKNRELVFHSYNKVFESEEMLIKQTVLSESKSSPWLFSIMLSSSSKIEISNVISQLADLNIETRPFFIPIHTLPMYSLANIPALPNAEQLGKNGISLPTSSLMSPDDAAYIGKHLVSIISG
jgi:perosamine synthetase